jgi:hypothetical protein
MYSDNNFNNLENDIPCLNITESVKLENSKNSTIYRRLNRLVIKRILAKAFRTTHLEQLASQ